MNFYFNLIKTNWKWILIAFILFILGIIAGYFTFTSDPQGILEITKELFNTLTELAEQIKKVSFYEQVFLILKQNTISATFIMISGIFIGILPVLFIWGNGTLIGILLGIASQQNEINVFVAGILPHAIFEIPAIIFATAWGLKIGHKTLLLFLSFFSTNPNPDIKKIWKQTFNEMGFIWLLVFVFLIIAAFVEIGITGDIIKNIS